MAERTQGIYRLITFPGVYGKLQLALSGGDPYGRVGKLLFEGLDGRNVLEIGCGPGRWSQELGHAAQYTGIDWNPRHIEKACQQYGSQNVRFICGDLGDQSIFDSEHSVDAVIGIGILHHLDDETATGVLTRAAQILVPEGMYIGLEPVLHARQNPIARLLKMLDSGRNIRTSAAYEKLFPRGFDTVQTTRRTDLMRVPYSHCKIHAVTRSQDA